MARCRIATDGFIDPDRLYRWPGGVQRATGLGRKVYSLRHSGGMRVLVIGRTSYARGVDVCAALERLGRWVESGEKIHVFARSVSEEQDGQAAAWAKLSTEDTAEDSTADAGEGVERCRRAK